MILAILVFFSLDTFANPIHLPFNTIVFLGDSLSDDGNLYYFDDGYLPQSPPYYKGRFTNGPTWAELTAKQFFYATSLNYAVGGATATLHNPINGYVPYSLSLEVSNYLVHHPFTNKSKTLFVIWIGCNDYLLTNNNINEATTKTVGAIRRQIKRLIAYGARHFVVINLPDISRSPYARQNEIIKNLHTLVIVHNEKLQRMLSILQANYPTVKIIPIDAFDPFNALLNNPKPFNQEYGTQITDVTTPCWNGGYSYSDAQLTAAQISMQLNQNNLEQGNKQLDTQQLLGYIENSSSLEEANRVAQSYNEGQTLCLNPNTHVFWDHIHPTEAVHTIMSAIITQDIQAEDR